MRTTIVARVRITGSWASGRAREAGPLGDAALYPKLTLGGDTKVALTTDSDLFGLLKRVGEPPAKPAD